MEPSIARRSHILAVALAFVPREALRHEHHRAVNVGSVLLPLILVTITKHVVQIEVHFCPKQFGIVSHGIRRRRPAILVEAGERTEQAGDTLQVFDVRFLRQQLDGGTLLRTQTEAVTALGEQVAQTFVALSAARASFVVAIAAFRYHTLGDDGRAGEFVTRVRCVQKGRADAPQGE